jgi:hypothetical protein
MRKEPNNTKHAMALFASSKRKFSDVFIPFQCVYCGKKANMKEDEINDPEGLSDFSQDKRHDDDGEQLVSYFFCSELHQKMYYKANSLVYKRLLYFAEAFELPNKNLLITNEFYDDLKMVILQKQIDILVDPYYSYQNLRDPIQFINRGEWTFVLTSQGVFKCWGVSQKQPYITMKGSSVSNLIFLCDQNSADAFVDFHNDEFNAIGLDNAIYKSDVETVTMNITAHGITDLDNTFIIISAASGRNNLLVLTTQGLYGTGSNLSGQLGLEIRTVYSWTKVTINDEETGEKDSNDVISVVCGWDHTFIITRNGKLYGSGNNDYGKLGLGKKVNENVFGFKRVRFLEDNDKDVKGGYYVKVLCVATSYRHTLILTNNGLYGCGRNIDCELGESQTSYRTNWPSPKKIHLPHSPNLYTMIKSIHCAGSYSMFLTYEGDLYATGTQTNIFGLSNPSHVNSAPPDFTMFNKIEYNGSGGGGTEFFKSGEKVVNISCSDRGITLFTSSGLLLTSNQSTYGKLTRLLTPPIEEPLKYLKLIDPLPTPEKNKKRLMTARTSKSCINCVKRNAKYQCIHPHVQDTIYFCSKSHYLKHVNPL